MNCLEMHVSCLESKISVVDRVVTVTVVKNGLNGVKYIFVLFIPLFCCPFVLLPWGGRASYLSACLDAMLLPQSY